jgi:hypothetical protein
LKRQGEHLSQIPHTNAAIIGSGRQERLVGRDFPSSVLPPVICNTWIGVVSKAAAAKISSNDSVLFATHWNERVQSAKCTLLLHNICQYREDLAII